MLHECKAAVPLYALSILAGAGTVVASRLSLTAGTLLSLVLGLGFASLDAVLSEIKV